MSLVGREYQVKTDKIGKYIRRQYKRINHITSAFRGKS